MHREHGSSLEAAADPGLHPGAVGQPQPRPPPAPEGARRQDARAPQDQGSNSTDILGTFPNPSLIMFNV